MQQDLRKSEPTLPTLDAPTEPEAFIRWCMRQPREAGRFELTSRGVERMQAGTSRNHNMICLSLVRVLEQRLDLNKHYIAHSDFAVRIGRYVRYPDILVDNVPSAGERKDATYRAVRPIFLAEVLSPSSAGRDFVDKTPEYLSIDSLRCHLIASQDEPRVWLWNRRRDRRWPERPTEIFGRDGTIKVAGLRIELPLAEIFRGLPDAPMP